jgi:hypothetical protein
VQRGLTKYLPIGFPLPLLATVLLACGSGHAPVNLAGDWAGTVTVATVSPPAELPATLTLTENSAGDLSGLLVIIFGQPDDETGIQLSGSLVGDQVYLSDKNIAGPATVQASVDPTGQHLTGTWSEFMPGVDSGGSGSLSLTKQ